MYTAGELAELALMAAEEAAEPDAMRAALADYRQSLIDAGMWDVIPAPCVRPEYSREPPAGVALQTHNMRSAKAAVRWESDWVQHLAHVAHECPEVGVPLAMRCLHSVATHGASIRRRIALNGGW